MIIFEAIDAGKQINGTNILSELSFSIFEGDKVAIVGHNGSGKSSLLKLIGGLYEASSGQVKRAEIKISYVPEHFPENIRFRMEEYLLILGMMNGKSKDELIIRIKEYAEIFGITKFLNVSLKHCSKGTKQKAGIIQALLMEPDLFLLDEPLTGLDDETQKQLLNQLNILPGNKTIIFTAHDSLLIEGLADRVITVANGKIILDEPIGKKDILRSITAMIPNKEVVSEIPYTSIHFKKESIAEITVFADHSDEVLTILLKSGSSIIELKEVR